jgi:hypothetical protein
LFDEPYNHQKEDFGYSYLLKKLLFVSKKIATLTSFFSGTRPSEKTTCTQTSGKHMLLVHI